MKLSEAIRLGSTMKPQGFGLGRSEDVACALDAAYLAQGVAAPDSLNWPAEWLPVCQKRVPCPVCGFRKSGPLPLVSVIAICLNDTHRWTRERIADWVEVLELELEMNRQPEMASSDAVPVASV